MQAVAVGLEERGAQSEAEQSSLRTLRGREAERQAAH